MADLDPNVIVEVAKTVAAIDERTKAFQKSGDERHAHVMQAIQTFVPRHEIADMIEDSRVYADSLAASTKQHCDSNRALVVGRVDQIEKSLGEITGAQTFIKRAVVGAVITGGIGLMYAFVHWVAPLVLAVLRASH